MGSQWDFHRAISPPLIEIFKFRFFLKTPKAVGNVYNGYTFLVKKV